ncbi:rifin PIR protein,putative [Plasmodium sp. DRC-Itaito]|nr:rifin PIR protein,putative [Plasmodium sp. DRC-Itaito]
MKIHYINILLFALPLNILAHNNNKPHTTARHKPTIRLLCECELYAPADYDNDPEMKGVMENFDRQTSQRFHEYDERMKTARQKCKDKCDKESQKIILKDKLEKELMDKFATLQTDIQSDAIPTCICEKSLADKMEKDCLRCGQILGAAMPEIGSIGGSLLYALNQWKPYALFSAAKYAMFEGAAKGAVAGKAAGMNVINGVLEQKGIAQYCPDIFESILKIKNYTDLKDFANPIITKYKAICTMSASGSSANDATCIDFGVKLGTRLPNNGGYGTPEKHLVPKLLEKVAEKAETTANIQAGEVSSATYTNIITKQTTAIDATYASWQTAITASIIAIVIIVLIMVIIYLVLRYRRKKKMKKKLQYIKLLEE